MGGLIRAEFQDALGQGTAGITGADQNPTSFHRFLRYTRISQHPQYGKIRNPRLDNDDFVFIAASGRNTLQSRTRQHERPAATKGGDQYELLFWQSIKGANDPQMFSVDLEGVLKITPEKTRESDVKRVYDHAGHRDTDKVLRHEIKLEKLQGYSRPT